MLSSFLLFPSSNFQLFGSSVFISSSGNHNPFRFDFFDFSRFYFWPLIVDNTLNDFLNCFFMWMIRMPTFRCNDRRDLSFFVYFSLFLLIYLPLIIDPIIENALLYNSVIVFWFRQQFSFAFESIRIKRRSHFERLIFNGEWLLILQSDFFIMLQCFLL